MGRVVVVEGAREEVRCDDVRMGESGRKLRKEQWEEIRNGESRSEPMRMAERLGEDVESKLNRVMNRERGWRREQGEIDGRI